MNTNHQWTRITQIDRKTDGPASTTRGAQMLLPFCALARAPKLPPGSAGVPNGLPFLARASRPHQAWHSLGHLPHLDQPGTAPWLSFGLADDGSRRTGWLPAALHWKLSGVPPKGQHAGGIASRLDRATAVPAERVAAPLRLKRQPVPAGGTPALPGRVGWLPAALHRSSAAAKGTACGRDARAPGQGKNREYGLHLSSMH